MLERSSEEDPRDGTIRRNSLHIAMDFYRGTFGHLGTGSVRDTSALLNEHCQSQFLLSCMIQGSFSGWNDCQLMGGGESQGLRSGLGEPLVVESRHTPLRLQREMPSAMPQPTAISHAVSPSASPAAWATTSALPPWLRIQNAAVLVFSALNYPFWPPSPSPGWGGFTPCSPLFLKKLLNRKHDSLAHSPFASKTGPHYCGFSPGHSFPVKSNVLRLTFGNKPLFKRNL